MVDVNDTTLDPRRTAAVPLFSWGGLMSPVFCVVLLTALALALLTPETFASNDATANKFAYTIQALLLQVSQHADINAHARSTAFPHAALLSHAFMWFGMMILFVFNTFASAMNWKSWMKWLIRYQSSLSSRQRKGVLITPLGAVFFAVTFSMIPGSASIVGQAELGSRIFFAVLTGAVVFLWQIAIYGWLPALYIIISQSTKK